MTTRLATAEWADPERSEQTYAYAPGAIWLGDALTRKAGGMGYLDDRHVCLVGGTRGGKGTTLIVNNLCTWPGSVVVVDPKGENATVTAARRGQGSDYCEGIEQDVRVLDPFRQATVDEVYRSRFNPLDVLDPQGEEAIDEAGRIADALVVVREASKDPYWDESARALVKGLILHILTSPLYEGQRNLVTLRTLVTRGDWQSVQILRADGERDIPGAQALLWTGVANNMAFNGTLAGIGESFLNMLKDAPKQFDSVIQVANRNTEFIDSPAMQRSLEASDFQLSSLKTLKQGMSLYLCLPQRFMSTHYRWLRMIITLTTTEMEKTPGKPATGHPILMVLDEFAGLKRMEVIENAVAQIAGYGVKLFFVLQNLEQLKATYQENWEGFLSNSGVKIFFNLHENFSRDYVSKLIGDTEIIREMRSAGKNTSVSEGRTQGGSRSLSETDSTSTSTGLSTSESTSRSTSTSKSGSTNRSASTSLSGSTNRSASNSLSGGSNQSQSLSLGTSESRQWWPGLIFGPHWDAVRNAGTNNSATQGTGTSQGWGTSDSNGSSKGWGTSDSQGSSAGWGTSDTTGDSRSRTLSQTDGASHSTGLTTSESWGTTSGTSRGQSAGTSETLHRRPLITSDELDLRFASITSDKSPAYPGLALVLASGERPMIVRRVNYFGDIRFFGLFDPHPLHEKQAIKTLTIPMDELMRRIDRFQEYEIAASPPRWLCRPGQWVRSGTAIAIMNNDLPQVLNAPRTGRVTFTHTEGEITASDQPLFAMHYLRNSPVSNPFAGLDRMLEEIKTRLLGKITGDIVAASDKKQIDETQEKKRQKRRRETYIVGAVAIGGILYLLLLYVIGVVLHG